MSIHIGLLILLAFVCFQILRPFVAMIVRGIIVAVAANPAYRRIKTLLGGRGKLAAVLTIVFFLFALIVPAVLLTGTLVEGIEAMTTHVKDGTLTIPAPPSSIVATSSPKISARFWRPCVEASWPEFSR